MSLRVYHDQLSHNPSRAAGSVVILVVALAIAVAAIAVAAGLTRLEQLLAPGQSARAAVTAMAATTPPDRLAPWVITADATCVVGSECVLSLDSVGANSLRPVRLSVAGGVADYRQHVLSGQAGAVPTPTGQALDGTPLWSWSVPLAPGNYVGPTAQAFAQLFAWNAQKLCDGGSRACASIYAAPPAGAWKPATNDGTICAADTSCPRVVGVLLAQESAAELRGRKDATVGQFGCLYIAGYQISSQGTLTINARFLGACHASAPATE
jgi:hypothetical protein